MRLREFIRQNREELDRLIANPEMNIPAPTNDDEREQWVLNDAFLYNWAQHEGVPV